MSFDRWSHFLTQVDRTPGQGGRVRDAFGWWLAYWVMDDGKVEWLGVTTNEVMADAWIEQARHDLCEAMP
jgi:hypothetical protein